MSRNICWRDRYNNINWQERYGDGGICDFQMNYDFYFKWLLNKLMKLFVITGLEDTRINEKYLKSQLILDGNICITEFNGDIYAVSGYLGGEPDEYYVPVLYTIANPVLGSKQVYRKDWKGNEQNGVIIFNTDIDELYEESWSGGLYDLVSQTATLLADNIVSINCQQINSRVQAFFTADGEAQALTGEAVLKKMYAGSPYQILRSDIVDKLTVNPISGTGVANNITQLVELQNFIVANFFQSVGVRSNDIMKRERLIKAEIEEQNDMVTLSLLEMITSWEKGFREVNEFYDKDIHVQLNPVLLHEIAEQFYMPKDTNEFEETSAIVDEESTDEVEVNEDTVEDVVETEEETIEETESNIIDELEEVVEDVIDRIIDDKGVSVDDTEEPENSESMVQDEDTGES